MQGMKLIAIVWKFVMMLMLFAIELVQSHCIDKKYNIENQLWT